MWRSWQKNWNIFSFVLLLGFAVLSLKGFSQELTQKLLEATPSPLSPELYNLMYPKNHKGERVLNYRRKGREFKNWSEETTGKKCREITKKTNGKEQKVKVCTQGISTNLAYQELVPRLPTKKITKIAIIDGGIDIRHHEIDWGSRICINEKEFRGFKGEDDDKNGYVDDRYGWNFLGDVRYAPMEVTREYKRLDSLKTTRSLTPEEQAYLQKVETTYFDQVNEIKTRIAKYQDLLSNYQVLQKSGLEKETLKDLKKLKLIITSYDAQIAVLKAQHETVDQAIDTELSRITQHYDAVIEKAKKEKNEKEVVRLTQIKTKHLARIEASREPRKTRLSKEIQRLETLKLAQSDRIPRFEAARTALTPWYELKLTSRDISNRLEQAEERLKYHYNLDFDSFYTLLLNDDPDQLDGPVGYGNNQVLGPIPGVILEPAHHGTHVAGIAAADRNDDVGMKGISQDSCIIPIRVVPDGDEECKHVADAITYAVNRGADVINMSFGKSFSPHQWYVAQAIRYAEENKVLIVHAAGNESQNNDRGANFPSAYNITKEAQPYIAQNWIEVGASNIYNDENLAADFSNYGQKRVDVFAPGVSILSSIQVNYYSIYQGTSMAAPHVTGLVALILSKFPELKQKPTELKRIILSTAQTYPNFIVNQPTKQPDDPLEKKTEPKKILFSELSVSGGIINVYNALKQATQSMGAF